MSNRGNEPEERELASPVCYGQWGEGDMAGMNHQQEKHRFITPGGATLDYEDDGTGGLVITHVEVPERQRGRGLAADLMKAFLAYASQEDKPVSATCTYARAYLSKGTKPKDMER